jgi:hypothetical protein
VAAKLRADEVMLQVKMEHKTRDMLIRLAGSLRKVGAYLNIIVPILNEAVSEVAEQRPDVLD